MMAEQNNSPVVPNPARPGPAQHKLRRPVIGIAIFFMTGTWLGLTCGADLRAPAILGGIVLMICAATAIGERIRGRGQYPLAVSLSIHVAFLAAAWINASLHCAARPPDFMPPQSGRSGDTVELLCTVSDDPYAVSSKNDLRNLKFPALCEAWRRDERDIWHETDCRLNIRLSRKDGWQMPRYGEKWRVSGTLRRADDDAIRGPRQRGDAVLAWKGAFISAGHGNSVVGACLKARESAARVLSLGIEDHPQTIAILNSLLLGYRSQMPDEIYQAFARTGTLHVFAISGSHVVVIVAVIIFALGLCRLPRTYWVLPLAPMLILYTIATGLQPSAVRACVMAIIFWLAPLIHRRPDIYSTLATSAIVILAVAPSDLVNIGFILSFVAVLGISLLYPVFHSRLSRLFRPDPLRLQPEIRAVVWARSIWLDLAALLATSAAAWIVSSPLTAYYFAIFSPVALVGNLLAIPLASVIIVTCAISLVAGSVMDSMASIFNHANLAIVSVLTWTIDTMAGMPCGWIAVDPPPLYAIIVFYAALSCAIAFMRHRTGNAATQPDE